MEKTRENICKFIRENELSPFNTVRTQIGSASPAIYKTRDAKLVHSRLMTRISSSFNFSDSFNIWQFFPFSSDPNEIKSRQEFFRYLDIKDTSFLKLIKKPKQTWSPRYDVVAVTENEDTFLRLNGLGCAVSLLSSERDLSEMEKYDIVQVIDCDNFERALESLPQSVFVSDIDDVYLERYLEILSAWKENLEILKINSSSEEILSIVNELSVLFKFLDENKSKVVRREDVVKVAMEINDEIEEKLKTMTISGMSLLKIVNEGKLPEDVSKIVNELIRESGVPEHIFNIGIPVTIDERELDDLMRRQSANEFTDLAEEIKSNSNILKKVPESIMRLTGLILLEDFLSGVYKYMTSTESFPVISEEINMKESKNYFLDNPDPISFSLDPINKCSILTGANSGGKTTLIEHIIQMNSLMMLGLPVNGTYTSPIFSDVYYFAKNKGATNKGAFENLLTQMSEINPGNRTLILADEIEAVTEPGVAGKIIASSAEYFLERNCFLIIATHLGHEISKVLPVGARVDGIEATGLDENFNLIVNHNPVIGRIASSTPELIVEKMANVNTNEYFSHLWRSIKSR